MHREGRYALVATVTPAVDRPGLWMAEGALYLDGGSDPVEIVRAGDTFETAAVAEVAAIEAARQVASTRDAAPQVPEAG
ncbi:conserved hypothetical protein [Luteimonas sp. 9C]|uniref:hypothetical protein n=1 Tax=Luteimonas sp. 9C TaxID=2653148 RepID=UPI0012EFFA70|nr:hypothetical protein [Luteimonas sp. 9C]VXC02738.1 conserved hypothetical protein [Luteimonas sp. 9C]